MKDEIGGYFNIELPTNNHFLHEDGLCVNSGRNALLLLLLSIKNIKHLWAPHFMCNVVFDIIKKTDISCLYYSINEDLEIKDFISLGKDDYLLVTNYFGLKESYIQELNLKYGFHLIVDYSQSFFSPIKIGQKAFFSPRKFFGVPDGGIAYSNEIISLDKYAQDISYNRCNHMLKRLDINASSAYKDYVYNNSLLKDKEIRRMSKLTTSILKSIDYQKVKDVRLSNFSILHEGLKGTNKLDFSKFEGYICPMVYPYLSDDIRMKQKLIQNKIYVPTYWPNVLEQCNKNTTEYILSNQIVPIPIDQRYGKDEMDYIVKIIKE